MSRFFKRSRLHLPAAALALTIVAASPALAGPVTFAQYFQSNGAEQQWSISTSGASTSVNAAGAVLFQFSGISGLPFAGPEAATFTLHAVSTQVGNCGVACGAGDSYVQPGYAGTFSFTDNGGGAAQGSNLLSGTFAVTGSPSTTGAQLSSHIGSSGGSFNASATAGNLLQLVMTSDYLNFLDQTEENASWSLSSLIPNFAVGTITANQAFPSDGPFNAAGSGTFSSNPGPTGAPEPGSLSLGAIGFGLCGLAFIKRRSKVTAGSRK